MAGALQTSRSAVEAELSRLPDERLVFLAQTRASRPARDVLISRRFKWIAVQVNRLAAKFHLSDEDREDAHQDAVLWFCEAIAHFDIGQVDRAHGCSFRSFVYHVISMRFRDFLRRLKRLDRHKRQLPFLGYTTDEGRRHLAAHAAGRFGREMSDVISAAQNHEMVLRLRAVLQQQDDCMREMGELLTAGVPLREIALRQSISYDAAKRRRRKMLKHLRYCLTE